MMKQFNRQRGSEGEEIAAKYLVENGFEIIDRNFGNKFGEIDLITTHENKLVFVEVKLKIGDRFGTPQEMINKNKIRQIRKTAQLFLLQNPQIGEQFPLHRLDAVCIVLNEDKTIQSIKHYENLE